MSINNKGCEIDLLRAVVNRNARCMKNVKRTQ